MPAGIQLYSDTGKLLYDSNVHRVLRLFKVAVMTGNQWTYNYATAFATYPVPGIRAAKHIALPFGDFSGSGPLVFTPIVENNLLKVRDGDGYFTVLTGTYTIYIMEYA